MEYILDFGGHNRIKENKLYSSVIVGQREYQKYLETTRTMLSNVKCRTIWEVLKNLFNKCKRSWTLQDIM